MSTLSNKLQSAACVILFVSALVLSLSPGRLQAQSPKGITMNRVSNQKTSLSPITFIGRWADISSNDAPAKLTIASGGSFRFKFTGSSVKLVFMPFTVDVAALRPEISYVIDGKPPVRIPLEEELLLSNLEPGEHSLIVWVEGVAVPLNVRRWTCRQGVGLRSVQLAANGRLSAYPSGNSKRLLVIGDSIGEGLLMLGGTAWANYPKFANGRLNFGNQLGARLRADVWFQCFGGAAIGKGFSDIPPAFDNYPFIFQGYAQQDPAFDAVIIEAGHNDGSVAPAHFVESYKTLIDKVRKANPRAAIFLFPPLKPYAPGKFELVRAVATDKKCVFVDNHDWKVDAPNDSHPSLKGHTQIAEYLTPIVGQALNGAEARNRTP